LTAVSLYIFNFSITTMFSAIFHKIRNNGLLCFLFKLLILFTFVFTLDLIIGTTLRHFYFKQKVGRLYRATYAIDKTTDQILIFGSSRAYHHYNPEVIQEELHLTCYNVGSPGQFIIYNYTVLKAVLERHNPEIIILDITPGEFETETSRYNRLSFLLPYYKDHPEIRSMINRKGPFEKYKLCSAIYPFNSSFLMIAGGNMDYFKKKKEDTNGFLPLRNILSSPIRTESSSNYELDTVKIKMLQSFINLCKESNVKLIMACSPSFIIRENTEPTIQAVKTISELNDLLFLDYSNDSLFINDGSLFDDHAHLNENGANVLSRAVCMDIISSRFLESI